MSAIIIIERLQPPMEIREMRDSANETVSLAVPVSAVDALTFVRADRINNADTNNVCNESRETIADSGSLLCALARPFSADKVNSVHFETQNNPRIEV